MDDENKDSNWRAQGPPKDDTARRGDRERRDDRERRPPPQDKGIFLLPD